MKKYYVSIIVTLLFFSCSQISQEELKETEEKSISTDTMTQTTCPFLTQDTKGNLVMSWVKEINDSVAIVCYASSTDKGYAFRPTTEIKCSNNVNPHGENLPKIIFKPNGEIIAAWGANNANPKNKYSGLVYYTQSFDEGKTWTNATPLVTDTASYDQRYFDMSLLPSGEVAMIWLDNRSKTDADGSTLYYAETNGKNGFKNEKVIGETCCQCCRTDLFIDSKGSIHAAYRDIINDSIRDMVHIVSIDQGKTFSQPVRISNDNWVISGCPHTGPTMAENKKGLQFAWHTMGGGSGVFFNVTKDNGKTFSLRDSVSTQASAKHAQLSTLQNDHSVIVWDETFKKGENFNVVIGFQNRTAEGKVITTKHISSEDAVSEFPVVKTISDNFVLVAWTQRNPNEKSGSLKKVVFKIVKVI